MTKKRTSHERPHERRKSVAGNGEGKVPTTAPVCASESPGSNPAAGADDGFGSREYWRAANAHAAKRLGEELEKNLELTQQRDHEARRATAAMRLMVKLDRERAAAERKLAICLRALDLLRRDSKSPDFVKVHCALIEDEIAILPGGGGA